jgi:pimeloyl-ACP methyl ester carboxylesterase
MTDQTNIFSGVAPAARSGRLTGFCSLAVAICALLLPGAALANQSTYVLYLPGISGARGLDRGFVRALQEGGLSEAIEMDDWTAGNPGIAALMAYDRNQREAERIATRIVERRRAHPAERFILIAHSGGCGIAAWALEKLPADVHVDNLVLLAPALSPRYDLSRALRRVRGSAVSLWSSRDRFVLGWGTLVFGTIDRRHTFAAGRVGFRFPAAGDAIEYRKLTQMPYDPSWLRVGHLGDHIGMMLRPFARDVLVPIVRELSLGIPATQPAR